MGGEKPSLHARKFDFCASNIGTRPGYPVHWLCRYRSSQGKSPDIYANCNHNGNINRILRAGRYRGGSARGREGFCVHLHDFAEIQFEDRWVHIVQTLHKAFRCLSRFFMASFPGNVIVRMGYSDASLLRDA